MTTSLVSHANEVVEHIPDNSADNMSGGWTSFLVGRAVSEPIGVIVAGLASAWAVANVQEGTGKSGNEYFI